jgi:siroheme synthase
MGLRTRGEIAQRLIARGWSPSTPAAIVLGASHTGAARWLGTVGTLGDAVIDASPLAESGRREPRIGADADTRGSIRPDSLAGVIVIGAVVELATRIANEHVSEVAAVRSL